MRRAVVVALALLAPAAARAEDPAAKAALRADGAVTWKATRGTAQRGRLPGSYVLASDAAPGRYSVGELITAEEVALPYRFTITWRRTGVEAGRSMHVMVAGGIVLIKSGRINFYAYDDAAFAVRTWEPIADHAAQAEHVVVVTQDAREVVVTIDGALAGRYPLAVARPTAHVGVGMKAAPGHRSKIYLRALAVEPLQ
jgi:hypothetical protein